MRGWGAALGAIALVAVAHAGADDDLRDGDRFFDQADWRHAAAAFDRALDKAPGQVPAEAYGKRAAIYIILKDYQGGLEFIRHAKARSKTLATAPELLEQEALILWETGHRDDAIAIANVVVAARPKTFTNQKLIGEYYATRDPVRTATALEAYLANRPGDLESGDVLPRIRLGFAYLARARAALGDDAPAEARSLYARATEQFELVERKHGKRPNARVNADNGLCAAYTGLGHFDRAVTVCERVILDPKHVDASGSVWFNLGTAYLARRQPTKARAAANEFTRVRKSDPRGLILLGDTYFTERDWATALDYYLRAEKELDARQPRDRVQLSIRLGKTYRRLPAPPTGTNPNLALAIDKLASAFTSNPTSVELGIELGGAYLESQQDAKAAAVTQRLLAAPHPPAVQPRASLLVLSGKALFNQHQLREARQRFEAAQQLRPGDVTIVKDLVSTINEQAVAAADDSKASQALLDQALAIDPRSPVTLTNLAVLAIDRGDCDAAVPLLRQLEAIPAHDEVVRTRLLARGYVCASHPDLKQAGEAFAVAERAAKQANAALVLAEIYTEWAPLLWGTDLDGALDRLERAVQLAAQDPTIAGAAKRNLAIALFKRGWKRLRDGRAAEAAIDLDRARRDPAVLEGAEPLAFEFAFALAQLDAGRASEAAKLFKALAPRGNPASYLAEPYVKVGAGWFAAYASYRIPSVGSRLSAAAELARYETEPGVADKDRDLLGSAWELIAYDQWRAGQLAAAGRSLAKADRYARGEPQRRLAMDRAALSLGKAQLPMLEALSTTPPEALVNLGILYDQLGRPREAYDAWTRAKAKGVQSRDLQKWIDAKKRIYGY